MELFIANMTRSVLEFGYYKKGNPNFMYVHIEPNNYTKVPGISTAEEIGDIFRQYKSLGLLDYDQVKSERLSVLGVSFVARVDKPFEAIDLRDLFTNYWYGQDIYAAERIVESAAAEVSRFSETKGMIEDITVQRLSANKDDSHAGISHKPEVIVDQGKAQVTENEQLKKQQDQVAEARERQGHRPNHGQQQPRHQQHHQRNAGGNIRNNSN